MKILTKDEFAKRASISIAHLNALIARGEGPPVIALGERRRGILEADGEAWLRSRTIPAGEKELAR